MGARKRENKQKPRTKEKQEEEENKTQARAVFLFPTDDVVRGLTVAATDRIFVAAADVDNIIADVIGVDLCPLNTNDRRLRRCCVLSLLPSCFSAIS